MWRGGGSIEGREVSVTSICLACPRSSFNHNPKYSHRPISASPAVLAFLILTNLMRLFPRSCTLSVCMTVYVCIHVHVCVGVEARDQHQVSVSITLHLALGDRLSRCIWTSSAQLGWLASEFSESVYLFSPHPTYPRAEVPDASCCT